MEPKLTSVFDRNLEAYKSGAHLIINQGGQGSSKTYSILQVLYIIAKHDGPKRITVVSYALPHLKQGALLDFEKILESFGENVPAIRNKTDNVYYIGKSTVDFFGVEGNESKAHGPRRDILFINEANRKISYDVYDHLQSRTQDCTILDFNPWCTNFIHEKIMPNFPHVLIKSNYLDNEYLPESERRNIEMKKDKPGFENWWAVYGEGNLGTLEGAILSNWRYGKEGECENAFRSLPYAYGLDFGHTDPDACVMTAIDLDKYIIYVDECFYKTGNSIAQLWDLIEENIIPGSLIVADSADPRLISELHRHFNIRPVNKGRWTVADALKMLQSYEIIVTESSHNLVAELCNYIWSDKKAGVPIGDFNHLIDALRYTWMDRFDRSRNRVRIANPSDNIKPFNMLHFFGK